MCLATETEKDRSGLSKVTATANETNTQKERDFMSNSTFEPGEIVRDKQTGELYRVASDKDQFGYVGYYRLAPQVEYIRTRFIEPLTTAQIGAQPEEKPSTETRTSEYPESDLRTQLIRRGASEKTTMQQLYRWGRELDISTPALLRTYESLGFVAQDSGN